jgi:hypothetical protein
MQLGKSWRFSSSLKKWIRLKIGRSAIQRLREVRRSTWPMRNMPVAVDVAARGSRPRVLRCM